MAKKKRVIKHEPFLRASTLKYKFPKQVIITPSGRCPVVLDNSEMIEVLRWANEVKDLGGSRKEYSLQAVQYWVRDFFPVQSKEWKDCLGILKDNHEELELKDIPIGVPPEEKDKK